MTEPAKSAPARSRSVPKPAGPSREEATARVAEIAERTRAGGPAIEDDLKVIRGIGPKIEGLLKEAGITSFEALSRSSVERLKEILVAAGSRYQMHDPGTWPAQAQMAAEGRWEDLKKWQDELDGGK